MTSPPRGRGLGGAKLRALRSGAVAAVYSCHRSLRARPETEQVLRHERVIEALMAQGPVLPLRFGTQLQHEEDLTAALARRGEELSLALERVRGRVELGIRVIPERTDEAKAHAAPGSGREMLLARVQQHQRATRIAHQLHAPLAGFAVTSTVSTYPRPPAILVASYLVDGERVAEFRRQADKLAERQEHMRVLVTGPWPPYSFTSPEQQ